MANNYIDPLKSIKNEVYQHIMNHQPQCYYLIYHKKRMTYLKAALCSVEVKRQTVSCNVRLFPACCRQAGQHFKNIYRVLPLSSVSRFLIPPSFEYWTPNFSFYHTNRKLISPLKQRGADQRETVIVIIKQLFLLARTKQELLGVLLKEWECGF